MHIDESAVLLACSIPNFAAFQIPKGIACFATQKGATDWLVLYKHGICLVAKVIQGAKPWQVIVSEETQPLWTEKKVSVSQSQNRI
jgi:hypothetical protein